MIEMRPSGAAVFSSLDAGFLRRDAARRHDEPPFRRHLDNVERAHRNKCEGRHVRSGCGQNRCVILATAMRADTAITIERAE